MNYKFSPKRDYSILAAILIIILVVLVITNNKTKNEPVKPITGEMPQDEIHKGLKGADGAPSKSNVAPEFLKQLETLQKAVEDSPNDTLKIREYADFLAQAHKIDEASLYYEKILRKYPKRTDLLFSMAYFNYIGQKFDKVDAYLNRVLKVDPANLDAKFDLGQLAAAQGKTAEAKKIWQEIVSKYPNNPLADKAREAIQAVGK